MVFLADPALIAIVGAAGCVLALAVLSSVASTVDRHARMAELRIEVGRIRRSRRRRK